MFRKGFVVWALTLLLLGSSTAMATGKQDYRVAVVGSAPPMSYLDAQGKLTGFNIEMAHALCRIMSIRCQLQPMPLGEIIDTLASGGADFAVASLLATPERRQKVIFSKPYFRSVSVWLGQPSATIGSADVTVGTIKGSAQARYAEAKGWKIHPVASHTAFPKLLASGQIQAVILPMKTGVALQQAQPVQALELHSFVLDDPSIAGDVAISIAPGNAALLPQINAAIDQVKASGEFDRINSRFLPFRLQ